MFGDAIAPNALHPPGYWDSDATAATTRFAWRRLSLRAAAVLLGALLLLLWPAMVNGYVLLNPDSMGYLSYGREIAQAIASPRTHPPFEARAEFYCLVVHLVQGDRYPWLLIGLQALLTSYVVYLVVRSVSRRRPTVLFLILIAVLGLFTGLSWQASWVMTDILGPVAYLCMYLLVFGWAGLSRAERWLLAILGWWCITAHLTHLLLAGAELALLAVLSLCRWQPMEGRRRGLVLVGGMLLF